MSDEIPPELMVTVRLPGRMWIEIVQRLAQSAFRDVVHLVKALADQINPQIEAHNKAVETQSKASQPNTGATH